MVGTRSRAIRRGTFSKLVSGFSDGRSCVYRDMAFVRDVPRRIARERVPTIEESRLVTSSPYSYGWSLWIIGFAP
jgi:hypothetical protein